MTSILNTASALKCCFISLLPCPEFFSSSERYGRSTPNRCLNDLSISRFSNFPHTPWVNQHVIWFFDHYTEGFYTWLRNTSARQPPLPRCILMFLPASHTSGTTSSQSSMGEKPNCNISLLKFWGDVLNNKGGEGQSQKSSSEPRTLSWKSTSIKIYMARRQQQMLFQALWKIADV